jgi:cobalt-zinc-cadmium efflux system outer membrane protein
MPRLAQRDAPSSKSDAKPNASPGTETLPDSSLEVVKRSPTASGLTLDDMERIALECNPTLVQANMNIRAAEGDYVQAGLYPNPTIGYRGDEIGNNGTAGFQGAFVRQEFVTAGKLDLARAVASHGVKRAQLGCEIQRLRILNDVRVQFCTVLLAQRVIETNEQLVRIGEENLKTTQQLQEASEASVPDVLQSQIETETSRASLANARHRHWSAWRQLAALVGRPDMDPCRLNGSCEEVLPLLKWEEVSQKLLSESPVLAQARAKVDQARCELSRQCALRTPNVEVSTAVKYDNSTNYTVADVEIGVPIPFHNRNQGNILRAQAQLTAAERNVKRLELALRQELADIYEQYLNARTQAETYSERILPNARKSLELIQNGYRQGEFSYLTLLTAQRTFVSANLNYLNNLQELVARRVTLEGMLLRGGLEEATPVDQPSQ